MSRRHAARFSSIHPFLSSFSFIFAPFVPFLEPLHLYWAPMTRVVNLTVYMHGQTALVTAKGISMKCELLKRHWHKMATGSQIIRRQKIPATGSNQQTNQSKWMLHLRFASHVKVTDDEGERDFSYASCNSLVLQAWMWVVKDSSTWGVRVLRTWRYVSRYLIPDLSKRRGGLKFQTLLGNFDAWKW